MSDLSDKRAYYVIDNIFPMTNVSMECKLIAVYIAIHPDLLLTDDNHVIENIYKGSNASISKDDIKTSLQFLRKSGLLVNIMSHRGNK